jgi:O-antigen ligase
MIDQLAGAESDFRRDGGPLRPARGAEVIVGVMALATPIVAWQGPAHTTVLDLVNACFLLGYWCLILGRREPLAMPFRVAMWLLLLGSFGGMVSAANHRVAMLTVAQDLYLYVWFLTLAHFVTQHCRLVAIVATWVVVACVVGLLAALDNYLGLFGGHFAGDVRATGTFENPNMFGDYLMVSFFLAWAAASPGRRIFYVAMGFLTFGVVATASNGALLGLLAGIGITVLVAPSAHPHRRAAYLMLGAGVGLALFGLSFERVQEQSLGMFAAPRGSIGGGVMKGYSERRDVWMGLLASVRRTPTGVGPGNFRTDTIAGGYSAHNEYLGMLAERGPLGLIAWLGILFVSLQEVLRLRAAQQPTDGGPARAALAWAPLFGLVVSLAAHATVVELFHFRHVWFALALLIAARTQTAPDWATAMRLAASRRVLAEAVA